VDVRAAEEVVRRRMRDLTCLSRYEYNLHASVMYQWHTQQSVERWFYVPATGYEHGFDNFGVD
jgi:hypothetical protein